MSESCHEDVRWIRHVKDGGLWWPGLYTSTHDEGSLLVQVSLNSIAILTMTTQLWRIEYPTLIHSDQSYGPFLRHSACGQSDFAHASCTH